MRLGGGTISPKADPSPTRYSTTNRLFLSFDIETAGEIDGIVQISAEIVCFKLNSAKKKWDSIVLTTSSA